MQRVKEGMVKCVMCELLQYVKFVLKSLTRCFVFAGIC